MNRLSAMMPLLPPVNTWSRSLIVLVLLLAVPAAARAQRVSKVGTTAAEFLQVDVGPRAIALGGAFVARADDASALYWNPAGLARLPGMEALATHAEWLADVNFDFLGAGFRVGALGTVGVSVTMLGVPEMTVRTEERQEGTGEVFDAADLAIGLSYGRAITDRFSVGLTGKYIQQRIWHMQAQGFAFDLGTQFRTDFFGGLVIGAMVSNFGADLRLGGRDTRIFTDPNPNELGNNGRIPAAYELDAFALPLNFQFGVALQPVATRLHRVTVQADALHPSSNYESLNVGLEYGFQERIYLRGGFNGLLLTDGEGGLSAGLGVQQRLFDGGLLKLDYAFRDVGRLGGLHVVGLGLAL